MIRHALPVDFEVNSRCGLSTQVQLPDILDKTSTSYLDKPLNLDTTISEYVFVDSIRLVREGDSGRSADNLAMIAPMLHDWLKKRRGIDHLSIGWGWRLDVAWSSAFFPLMAFLPPDDARKVCEATVYGSDGLMERLGVFSLWGYLMRALVLDDRPALQEGEALIPKIPAARGDITNTWYRIHLREYPVLWHASSMDEKAACASRIDNLYHRSLKQHGFSQVPGHVHPRNYYNMALMAVARWSRFHELPAGLLHVPPDYSALIAPGGRLHVGER